MKAELQQEGRAFSTRVDINFDVLVRCGEGDVEARIVNISADGICLRSAQKLEPGCIIDIEIGTMPPVRALVRWADGSDFGAMFVDPAPL
jgi:hypothetical protein